MKTLITALHLIVVFAITNGQMKDRPPGEITNKPFEASGEFSRLDSGYVAVEGGKIFYEASGQGQAIVMIHDGLLHRETWDAQFSDFAKRYRVVRWDRRGYGRSLAPKSAFSDVEDLLGLMRKLNIEHAVLMGCSAGSVLAIDFVLEYPDMVTALVLVGPIVSGLRFSEHFLTRGKQGIPAKDASVEQKIEYWTAKDPWIVAPENVAAKQKMRSLLKANPQNLNISAGLVRRAGPALGKLSRIKAPTLIVLGEADISDVHAHAGAIQAGIAGSQRIVLTDTGHLPHLEVPESFNQVVLDFLGKIE